MAKRLTKEELHSDPLIENYNRASIYLNENKPVILSIVVGLIVIIGALIGYSYYSSNQEEEAQSLLSVAENYYTAGDYEEALNGDDFELTYGFRHIAKEFSGTKAGNLAAYYAAVSSFKLGNTEEAIQFIKKFDVPDGILGVAAVSFHAALLEANGDYNQAAQKYQDAAEWDKNDTTTPYNLYKAAEAYFAAENFSKAEELTKKVINEYPNSAQLAATQKLQGMIAATQS